MTTLINKEIFKKIRIHISHSELRQAIKCLSTLKEKHSFYVLDSYITILEANYNRLCSNEISGILTLEEKNISYNRIAKDVLSIISALEAKNTQNIYLTSSLGAVNWIKQNNGTVNEYESIRNNLMYYGEKVDFEKGLKSFCKYMLSCIDYLDHTTRWDDKTYINLEVEIDVWRNNSHKRRTNGLIKAIHQYKTDKLFLLLGDPGSGKSVALRRLCRQLLAEFDTTKRIPIYINLKSWFPDKSWSNNTPPTTSELNAYIKNELTKSFFISDFVKKFIHQYFDRLLINQKTFIILDAFDEIPKILDEKENSKLIG